MTKQSVNNSPIADLARKSLAGQSFNVGKGFEVTKIESLDPAIIENIVTMNDLSKLTARQQTEFIKMLCQSLGLNPLSKPLQLVEFDDPNARSNDKKKTLRVYATRDCTDQLRRIYGISVDKLEKEYDASDKTYSVTAYVSCPGRTDIATGIVSLEGRYQKSGETKYTSYDLTGQAKGNAKMKAETKAKRRATLSICGLGFLDETEVESIDGARVIPMADPVAAVAPAAVVDGLEMVKDMISVCETVEQLEAVYESGEIEKYDDETQNVLFGLLNARYAEINGPEAPEEQTSAATLATVKGLIDGAKTRADLDGIYNEYVSKFKPESILIKFKGMLNQRREAIRREGVKTDTETAAKSGGLFQKRSK